MDVWVRTSPVAPDRLCVMSFVGVVGGELDRELLLNTAL
jgi:hypothetical protein